MYPTCHLNVNHKQVQKLGLWVALHLYLPLPYVGGTCQSSMNTNLSCNDLLMNIAVPESA